jgi:hypothetical protein
MSRGRLVNVTEKDAFGRLGLCKIHAVPHPELIIAAKYALFYIGIASVW